VHNACPVDTHLVGKVSTMTRAQKKRSRTNSELRQNADKGDVRPIRSYELQHREAAIRKLLNEHPSKIVRSLAKRSEAEWHIGRLYLVGVLSHNEYAAGAYIDQITRAYEAMIRRHGQLKAGSLEKTDTASPEDLSLSARKKFARLKRKHDEVYGVLSECGNDVNSAVVNALRKDDPVDISLLSRGLTVISVSILGMRDR